MKVRSVLITGTTSGVGRGLLQHYVEEGASVIAVNRRRVVELESRFPSVRFECVDVRSAEDVERLVRDLGPEGFFIATSAPSEAEGRRMLQAATTW